ncbi:MAG: hypothetical protein WCJ71_08650 [Candidatus Omnitrophota bacterium]
MPYLFHHIGVVGTPGLQKKPKKRETVSRKSVLLCQELHGPAEIIQKIDLFCVKPFLELQPFEKLFGEAFIGKDLDFGAESLQVLGDSFFFLRGQTVLIDVCPMELNRICTDQLEILSPIDVGIFRATDTKMVEKKISDLPLELRILDETEVFVRRDRPFIAFLQDCFYTLGGNKVFDDLRDILLSLKGVVGVLDEDHGLIRSPAEGFFYLSKFFGD